MRPFHSCVSDSPSNSTAVAASSNGDGTEIAVHFSARPSTRLSFPYSPMIPKECDGFALRFVRFVDGIYPEKHTLLMPVGDILHSRITGQIHWVFWFCCVALNLAMAGISIHTLDWLMQDPIRAAVRPTMYLVAIYLIWQIEQTFCVFVRPVIALRSFQGYIRDWSTLRCYSLSIFCTFAFLVIAGNVTYGLFQVYTTWSIRDCVPFELAPYSSVVSTIVNCTKARGVGDTDMYSLVGMVGGFGQTFMVTISPVASSAVLTIVYLIASIVWATTPLQFAIVMMMNVAELRSANNVIQSQLLYSDTESASAENILKHAHKHIVAADIGACRCNEVFGIGIAVNLVLDIALSSVILSALQDPLYQKNTVLQPVTAFWMTANVVHICAFLLPIGAYNANLRNIQVLLYKYSARLNGLLTPSDSFDAWAQPLSASLLKRLNDKVIALGMRVCLTTCCVVFKSLHTGGSFFSLSIVLQVNTKFDSTEFAVVHSCLRLAGDMNSATFQVAGILPMSYRFVISLVSIIAAASGFVSQYQRAI